MPIYAQSVPVFAQSLKALAAILTKAEAHGEAKKISPEVMLGLRLVPDMFDVKRQVQISCDFAKNTAARLAGADIPRMLDEEQTFEALQERIAKTLAFIQGLDAAAFEDAATKTVQFPIAGKPYQMEGEAYLASFALPNFYFHLTTAYAILRANGVALGKMDFLGEIAGMRPVGA
jgi:uncharacterized protein